MILFFFLSFEFCLIVVGCYLINRLEFDMTLNTVDLMN